MRQKTLYGIGVGPGNPDLLTIRAAKILGQVDVVFAAASSRNEFSHALEAARPHLKEGIPARQLDFPMLRDKTLLEEAWRHNARAVAHALETRRAAAFLTLGDPLVYSTFGYLMRALQTDFPEVAIRVIPGVTSFQAAAAETETILCEGSENLLLLSGIAGKDALEASLAHADNAVILKIYRNLEEIREVVGASKKNAVLVSRIGMPGQKTVPIEDAPEKVPYLSLALVKKRPPS